MDSPIRGRTRQITNKVDATVPMNIHNRFDIEVIDSQTGEIKQRAQAENVICSQLWTRLLAPNTYFNYIHYGTGSGTPASTNTSLFTFLGYGTPSSIDDVIAVDDANSVWSIRKKIQLSETTAVGSTLTEVGIGYGTTSATLCTHAMLKDANGNQISIVKTSTDIINIYATVFCHWDSSLNFGNIRFVGKQNSPDSLCGQICGVSVGGLPNYAYFQSGPILCSTSEHISGTISANSNAKTFTITFGRLASANGNWAGGIGCIICKSSSYYQSIVLYPGAGWYTGTDVTAEAIGTGNGSTVDFATKFDYPSNATIYIDGVASPNVTVDQVPLAYNDMGKYFQPIVLADGAVYPTPSPKSGMTSSGYLPPATIFYNPNYAYGIASLSYYDVMAISDDIVTWIDLTSGTVPTAYQNYKYWKNKSASSAQNGSIVSSGLTGKNIHFTTAPASGAVITADYHTPTIAKDTNHVFDLTVTIQLGEYTA